MWWKKLVLQEVEASVNGCYLMPEQPAFLKPALLELKGEVSTKATPAEVQHLLSRMDRRKSRTNCLSQTPGKSRRTYWKFKGHSTQQPHSTRASAEPTKRSLQQIASWTTRRVSTASKTPILGQASPWLWWNKSQKSITQLRNHAEAQ